MQRMNRRTLLKWLGTTTAASILVNPVEALTWKAGKEPTVSGYRVTCSWPTGETREYIVVVDWKQDRFDFYDAWDLEAQGIAFEEDEG